MNNDDIIYLVLLILVVVIGFYIRTIESKTAKQWTSTLIGIIFTYIVAQNCILYFFICIFMNIIIIFFIDKSYSRNVCFIFCFLYLALFRMAHLIGLPEPSSHLNAIEMMHTLKMISLVFEMHDTTTKEADEATRTSLEYTYTKVKPTYLDVFHYSFCYIGLLAGPYFKFRTYWDWIHMPYSSNAPTSAMVLKRIRVVPLYLVAYLIGNYIYPLEYTETEIYYHSCLYRWWYMTPLFFNFRMRLYVGFILSECSCIAAGLGVYPSLAKSKPGHGPTNYEGLEESSSLTDSEFKNLDYNFETVHNIDVYGSEFVPTMREAMKCWNMTVQYWLAMFVHKRVKKFRVATTMFVSSFWHGVYPGYYLCLLSVPFQLMAEASMDRALRRDATPLGKKVYDWICWVLKMQAFSYMGMAFYLLQIKQTLKFWSSLYFFGHILIGLFYVLGRGIQTFQRSHQTRSSTNIQTQSLTSTQTNEQPIGQGRTENGVKED